MDKGYPVEKEKRPKLLADVEFSRSDHRATRRYEACHEGADDNDPAIGSADESWMRTRLAAELVESA